MSDTDFFSWPIPVDSPSRLSFADTRRHSRIPPPANILVANANHIVHAIHSAEYSTPSPLLNNSAASYTPPSTPSPGFKRPRSLRSPLSRMLTYSPKRPSLARGDSNEFFASASVRDMETQLPIPRPPLRNVRSDTALKRLSQRYSNVLRKHKSHAFIKIPPVPTNASSVPPTPMSALLHFDPT